MTREINYLSTDGARRAAHRKLWGLCPSAPMSLFLKRVSASLAHPRGAAAGRIGAQRGGVRRRSGRRSAREFGRAAAAARRRSPRGTAPSRSEPTGCLRGTGTSPPRAASPRGTPACATSTCVGVHSRAIEVKKGVERRTAFRSIHLSLSALGTPRASAEVPDPAQASRHLIDVVRRVAASDSHQGRMQRRCARVREPHPNHASAVEGGEARAATGGPGTRVTRPARWARHAWQRRRDGHEYHES